MKNNAQKQPGISELHPRGSERSAGFPRAELRTPFSQSPEFKKATLPTSIRAQANERERTRSAAVTLALFWGLALVCLMIPYANLVMTPLLFITGPFAAWKASR